jgi:hypothetical protein
MINRQLRKQRALRTTQSKQPFCWNLPSNTNLDTDVVLNERSPYADPFGDTAIFNQNIFCDEVGADMFGDIDVELGTLTELQFENELELSQYLLGEDI